MLPKNIIFMRHGMSESNVVYRESRRGNEKLFTDDFYHRDDADMRLTRTGIHQAMAASEFIKEKLSDINFTQFYCSSFVRAMETASFLTCFKDPKWIIHWELAERDWGDVNFHTVKSREEEYARAFETKEKNPFEWKPDNGESMRDAAIRAQAFINELEKQQYPNASAMIVCHEEIMRAFRVILEKRTPQDYIDLEYPDESERLHNCCMIHYTRISPEGGYDFGRIGWYRLLDPLNPDRQIGEWHKIEQKTYNTSELRALYKKIKPLHPHYKY